MSKYISILPSNSTPLERAIEQSIVSTQQLKIEINLLWNPDKCLEHLLPWLAWAYSVDVWDDQWPEQTKRNVIKASLRVHSQKGSIGSIKRALHAAGYGDAEIREGTPATLYDGKAKFDGTWDHSAADHWAEYRVILKKSITIDQAQPLIEILKNTAPARCRLKGLFYTEAASRYDGTWSFDGSRTHGVVAA